MVLVLADPGRIDENFERPGLSAFAALGIVKVLLLVVWMAGVGGSSRLSRFLGLMVLLVFSPRLRSLGFGQMVCWMLTLP